MVKYLVTGGAGFIGSHVVDRLLSEENTAVTVIDNFDDYYDPRRKRFNIAGHLSHPAYRLIELDIRDHEALRKITRGIEVDAIVHLAARPGVRPSLDNPQLYQEVNVAGTLNLLEFARSARVPRFIFASSSSVYGKNPEVQFSEDAALAPISPYAATKAAGELLAHTYSHLYDIQVICLRFFTVYGARQRPDLAIHKFADRISRRQPIPVYGDGTSERDYTYIDDIVGGILASLSYEASRFEILNLGKSKSVSLNRLIELLEASLGQTAIIERLPAQPGDLQRTLADTTKAERLLGYQPSTSIEAGIRKFVEWFSQTEQSRTTPR